MKNLSMLVWLSQLGLSVALPPAVLIMLAVWLRDRMGLGSWVIWLGVVIGIICAIDGLRSSLKAMQTMAGGKNDSPVAFNEHD